MYNPRRAWGKSPMILREDHRVWNMEKIMRLTPHARQDLDL
jgi:hypothetical protein